MIRVTVFFIFIHSCSSFSGPTQFKTLAPAINRRSFFVATDLKAQEDGEVEFGEKYEGEIDWDAEWKKVVSNKDQPKIRPGNNFYKSDAEKTIIKATRSAQEKIIDVQKKLPQLEGFDFRSLQGNATFWFTILAIISIGSALIAASGQSTPTYNDQSFYI